MEFPERFHWSWCPTSGKKGDLMFAQHMLHVCKPDGMVATVMPHGVPFRGGAEKEIRKKFLEQDLFTDVPGYARVVDVEEIADPLNDWNLNIRRYVDNAPPPEPHDVRAHHRYSGALLRAGGPFFREWQVPGAAFPVERPDPLLADDLRGLRGETPRAGWP